MVAQFIQKCGVCLVPTQGLSMGREEENTQHSMLAYLVHLLHACGYSGTAEQFTSLGLLPEHMEGQCPCQACKRIMEWFGWD